ncbi:hypothetical protein QRX25_14865 [Bacillus sp. L381]|uniref:hypothetical protein n=1 Tax=Bacillus TaxID=1386 RepID=UPI001BA45F5E|nr:MULTISPECIES: hypothetical protein [Bacillus]MCR9040816.1 hypothetical protein [Bacillus velezensis]QUN08762.1 hypothetical protein KEF49_14660 [Bacillus amyloliquefaciens]QYM81834.1 hypothetical protein KTJ85_14505 [Bacillus sp. 7D3]QZY10980.1 hypothetical protein K7B13_14760 [Bacillus amyloliquefaciens]WIX20882.1 hypothetical protein QRX25_14865 [Bacillus sp. L381]
MGRFNIGDIVKAKNSHKECGYKRGDIIRVKRKGYFSGNLIGENLTEPSAYGNSHVYIGDFFRGKRIQRDSAVKEPKYKFYFLGIPILSVRKEQR